MIQLTEGAVIAAFLAFCRVGSCFMLMPGLSSARVPMQVRLFVAVAVTGALLATLWDAILPHVSREPALLAPLIVSEILTGAMLGLLARFYMMALQFMGSAIALRPGDGMTQRRRHGRPVAKAALRDTPPVDVIYRGRSPGLRVFAPVRLPEAWPQ